MIRVTCSECSKVLVAKDSRAGQRGRCPDCGSIVLIPDVVPEEPKEPAPDPLISMASGATSSVGFAASSVAGAVAGFFKRSHPKLMISAIVSNLARTRHLLSYGVSLLRVDAITSPPLTPRVFVSAVSSEFRTARKSINDALIRIECLPVEETTFGTEYGVVREMLARKIESCQAVIHLVGKKYGGEPNVETLDGHRRRSWTQIEFDLAKEKKRKLYLLVCGNDFICDSSTRVETAAQSNLQQDHHSFVQASKDLWYKVGTPDDLVFAVDRMKIQLDEIRIELRRQQIRYRWASAFFASTLVLVSVGITHYGLQVGKKMEAAVQQIVIVDQKLDTVKSNMTELPSLIDQKQQETVQQLTDPAMLAQSLRRQIRDVADAKIKSSRNENGSWKQEAEIKRERDIALGNIDAMMTLIQENLKGGASPVFQKATSILQDKGVEDAIAFLESERASTLETAKRLNDQIKSSQARIDAQTEERNKTLQVLTLKADLLETRLQWDAALKARKELAEIADDWFVARLSLGQLQNRLAHFKDAELNLKTAINLARTSGDKAIALNNLAVMFSDTQQWRKAEILMRRSLWLSEDLFGSKDPRIAMQLRNLAHVLLNANRFSEAEPLLHRALSIFAESGDSDRPVFAVALDTMAQLLGATNRLKQSEALLCCAIVINENSLSPDDPNAVVSLNNLGKSLLITNRPLVALPLLLRALIVAERSYGPVHPAIATYSDNLATALDSIKRVSEAELLVYRALAIDIKLYTENHAKIATRLNNLSTLVRKSGQMKLAEQLARHAFVIFEASRGPEDRGVATSLFNLAGLCVATNRITEAESMLRRSVAIFGQFELKSGRKGAELEAAKAFYCDVLLSRKIPIEKCHEEIRSAMTMKGPLPPFAPEVKRLLGQLRSLHVVLAELDEGKPLGAKTLTINEPITPRLSEVLAEFVLKEPISKYVETLHGGLPSAKKELEELDRQYHQQDKPAIWFLPLTESISPHLEKILGDVGDMSL